MSWGEDLGSAPTLWGRTGVGVDAPHFLSFGRSPLYLIQRGFLCHWRVLPSFGADSGGREVQDNGIRI